MPTRMDRAYFEAGVRSRSTPLPSFREKLALQKKWNPIREIVQTWSPGEWADPGGQHIEFLAP